MLRCIETICYEHGAMPLLAFHQQRFLYTQLSLWQNIIHPHLETIVQQAAEKQTLAPGIKYKCRVVYGYNDIDVQFEPYRQAVISSLVLKQADHVAYPFKYENREAINRLKQGIAENTEILLLQNNLLTDTSFTNIALLQNDIWFTPAKPLLRGVQRAYLLKKNIIFEKEINVKDLCTFEKVKLFNAMVGWQQAWELPVNTIQY